MHKKIMLMPQSWDLDKPFVDYSLQIKRLRRRGVIIGAGEEEAVISLIKAHGYYDLINGYGTQFEHEKGNGEKHYKEETTFQDIYSQFYLDHELGKILFNYILDIEEHFKNTVAYSVSKHFGVYNYWREDENDVFPEITSYLDKSFYPGKQTDILNDLHSLSLNEKKNPTAHYRKNYNHIPPWILFMNVTLGTMNRYYEILPTELKAEIITEMLAPKLTSENFGNGKKHRSFFFSGIELMREFRNCIAHGSRIYAYQCRGETLPKRLKNVCNCQGLYSSKEFRTGIGQKDLYALLIWLVITSQDAITATTMIEELYDFLKSKPNSFSKQRQIFFNGSHLPVNFASRLRDLANSVF